LFVAITFFPMSEKKNTDLEEGNVQGDDSKIKSTAFNFNCIMTPFNTTRHIRVFYMHIFPYPFMMFDKYVSNKQTQF
jgi:hypothetical protein